MPTSESILIKELKEDSQLAFKEIYKIYSPRLYAFGLQYCKSRESLEELVQDTFIWLWNNRHKILQDETLKSILYIRMHHFLINAYRSTVNSPIYENYINYENELLDSAQDKLEYDDFKHLLNNAIEKLNKTQRNVVRLSKFEMLSNSVIAERLNLKEQTVKNQLSLALKEIKENLGLAFFICYILFYVN